MLTIISYDWHTYTLVISELYQLVCRPIMNNSSNNTFQILKSMLVPIIIRSANG